MSKKNILVVEDKEAYRDHAREALRGHDYTLVDNYAMADLALSSSTFDVVLTDLFIPAGAIQPDDLHKKKVAVKAAFDSYFTRRYPQIEHNVVYAALAQVAKLFEQTPEQFVTTDIYKQMYSGQPRLNETILDQVNCRQDYTLWQKHTKVLEHMLAADVTQSALPLGLSIAISAQTKRIPTCVVTDIYHHDMAFEPIRPWFTAPSISYIDVLVGGKKPWARALEEAR